MNTTNLTIKERAIRAQIIRMLIENHIEGGMGAVDLFKKSYRPTFVRELNRCRKVYDGKGQMRLDTEFALVSEIKALLPEVAEHIEREGRNKERMERLGTAKLVERVVHEAMKKESRR